MKNKFILYCFVLAFVCWFIPFVSRTCFIEIPDIEKGNEQYDSTFDAMHETLKLFQENDKYHAFITIFKNNIRGCVINIIGGVMLGLGTLINLAVNGFFFADMFDVAHKSGLSIDSILRVTLPHSFELIGFWLSGAIGFYIAWNIIQFMRGKEGFTSKFYKNIGIYFFVVFIIILSAAFVEAYISISLIK